MRFRSSAGYPFGPQRLRHDAEHRPAVEPERAVAQGDQFQVAETVTRISDFRFKISDWPGLLQLHQHAVGARRVDERDERALRPAAAARR